MTFRSLMNNTATVKLLTATKDDYGTVTEVESIRFGNMPCRIQPMSGREQAIYGSEREVSTHKMFCEGKYKTIVVHDTVTDADGNVYNIKLVRDIDRMGHHMEVEMQLISPSIA